MKILVVSALLPWPLVSGGQVRMYQLLRHLSKHHDITLVSFIRDEEERNYVSRLSFFSSVHLVRRGKARQARYLLKAVTGVYPWLLATYDSRIMRQEIAELLSENSFDLLHIEPFYVLPSLPAHSLPLVVAEHNIEYRVYEDYVRHFPVIPLRPLLSLDTFKLRLWEERAWRRAAAVIAVSEQDKSVIGTKTEMPVTVVPNGVDLSAFPLRREKKDNAGPLCLFVGNFSWLPNVDAAGRLLKEIWPLLQRRVPTAVLRIVGRNMPGTLFRMARQIRVEVAGEVTDIAKEYAGADILLAPVAISGGTKFKMLEAMASGLPIITTAAGMTGLGAMPGVHYIEAAGATDFVAKAQELWDNTKLRQTVGASGRSLVESSYSWDAIAKRQDDAWRIGYEKKS